MGLQANELRIGNIIFDPKRKDVDLDKLGNGIYRVSSWAIERHDSGYLELKPIPLTEEWLEKFGFEREDKTPSIEHSKYFSMWVMDYKYSFAYAPFREDWGFYHSYTDAGKEEENNRFDFISCGIKYIHQLQNLYYALCGTELEIK